MYFSNLAQTQRQLKSYFLYISQPHHMENFIPQTAAYQKCTMVWKKGCYNWNPFAAIIIALAVKPKL